MQKLDDQLSEIESQISKQSVLNETISKSSVGWHLEHILLTIDAVIGQLSTTDPANYKWKFSLPKLIIYTLNKIPRGRARSPKTVLPESFSEQSLTEHVQSTKANVQKLLTMNNDQYFAHPIFGHLKLGPTKKFLRIHTEHHLKIIRDINKKL